MEVQEILQTFWYKPFVAVWHPPASPPAGAGQALTSDLWNLSNNWRPGGQCWVELCFANLTENTCPHFSLGRAQQFSLPAHGSKEKSASSLKQWNNVKSFFSPSCFLRQTNLGIVLNASALQPFLGSQSHCTETWNKHPACFQEFVFSAGKWQRWFCYDI